MAWLCIDEDGQEMIFDNIPVRYTDGSGLGYWSNHEKKDYCNVDLPRGTIKKLIGKELTWNDDPVLYDGYHDFEDKPIEIENKNKRKGINWRILALSIIWSLLLICLSDFAVGREGSWKWIAIGFVTIIMSFVFYFGYKDVDIKMSSSYTEDEKDFFNK